MQITAKVSKKRPRVASKDSDETCVSDEIDEEKAPAVTLKNKENRRVCKVQKTKHISKKRAIIESDESQDEANDYECVECFDDYQKTKSKVDWIKCIMCRKWLHEDCTLYGDYCNQCGRTRLYQTKKSKK